MKTSVDFLFFLRTQNCLEENTCREYQRTAQYLGKALQSELALKKFCLGKQMAGYQPETLNKYLKVARWWCLYQKKDWYKDIRKFRCFPKYKQTLTEEEVKEFINLHTSPVLDAFWLLHIFSGTRPSEVANLKLDNIDLNYNFFCPEDTKTHDGKPIIIFSWVAERLKLFYAQQKGPFLFSYTEGRTPISIRTVQKDCQKRLKLMNCQKRITPHSFRHTYATLGIASGKVPVQYMQRLLRHSRITTTMHYLDQSVDFMRQAAMSHPYVHFYA